MVSRPIFPRVQDTQALVIASVCRCSLGLALGSVVVALMCRTHVGLAFLSQAVPWGPGSSLWYTWAAAAGSAPPPCFYVPRCWNVLGDCTCHASMLGCWSLPPPIYRFTVMLNTWSGLLGGGVAAGCRIT